MRILLYAALVAASRILVSAEDTTPPPATAASQPPDSAKTVPRALTYLVQNGSDWMTERNCASCHHLPMMIWSMREAKKSGFAIDEKALAKAIEWTVSPKVVATTFLKAKTPDRDMVSMTGAWLAFAFDGGDGVPQETWKQMLGDLLHFQKPDGSWAPNLGSRAPILASTATHVPLLMTNALSIHARRQADPETNAAQEKAVAWLTAQPAEESTQYHALRLWLDTRLSRAPEDVKKSIEWLRSKQKTDGGWAQTPDGDSDAYATGQAVFALNAAGIPTADPAIQRARDFLCKTQTPDGSWAMKSHPTPIGSKGADNLEPIIYTATGWATIALCRTEPPK